MLLTNFAYQVRMASLLRPCIFIQRAIGAQDLHVTACCGKNQKTGKHKISSGRRKHWQTYEKAIPPEKIGHAKAWNSWNTSNLYGEDSKTAETTVEDMIIRRFMVGLFPEYLESEVIIKRRHNLIVIAAVIQTRYLNPDKIYFLVGFAEEWLTTWFKRPVKLEISTVGDSTDTRYKLI